MRGCNFGGVVPICFVTVWPEVQDITLTLSLISRITFNGDGLTPRL
jgi:hypothetical protein